MEINEISAALSKAQAKMQNASFNKVNPHFKSKYADLASIRDAVVPALSENGIALVQLMEITDGTLVLLTKLAHSSGQFLESRYPVISATGKPQDMGSALTYARRYSMSAICGIASEEDDDGNAAQSMASRPAETKSISGTQGASKAKSREAYSSIVSEMKLSSSLDALKEWLKMRRSDIEALPSDWISEFDDAYAAHRETIEARAG
jgi:hypothetical protein